jgi:hypothetical protein
MNRKLLFIGVLFLMNLHQSVYAQSGGNSTFDFLNLVAPARAAALGGNAISTPSEDITLFAQNPALLRPSMDLHVSTSYVGHLAGIKYGNVLFAKDFSKVGTFGFNMQYISYGEFDETNVNAEKVGVFKAGEYAFNVAWSKALDSNLYVGANVKYILSSFGSNTSNGIATDVALNWMNDEKLWSAAFVVKNVGTQLKTYEGAEREKLPFEIQVGVSRKLPKAPFRFSLIAQQLQKFDLSFKDPNASGIDPLTGESQEEKLSVLNKFSKHLILNLEILFTQNFNVRVGYNFLRRYELQFPEKKGMSGFSLGFGFKINRFQISYANTIFNPAGGSNHFTISTNLKRSVITE